MACAKNFIKTIEKCRIVDVDIDMACNGVHTKNSMAMHQQNKKMKNHWRRKCERILSINLHLTSYNNGDRLAMAVKFIKFHATAYMNLRLRWVRACVYVCFHSCFKLFAGNP